MKSEMQILRFYLVGQRLLAWNTSCTNNNFVQGYHVFNKGSNRTSIEGLCEILQPRGPSILIFCPFDLELRAFTMEYSRSVEVRLLLNGCFIHWLKFNLICNLLPCLLCLNIFIWCAQKISCCHKPRTRTIACLTIYFQSVQLPPTWDGRWYGGALAAALLSALQVYRLIPICQTTYCILTERLCGWLVRLF